jgi:hypothetical protein
MPCGSIFRDLFLLRSTLAFLSMLLLAMPVAVVACRKRGDTSVVSADRRFHWRAVWIFLVVISA